MVKGPLCPHCSTPLVNAKDVPNFKTTEIITGLGESPTFFWAVSCGKCSKLLGILPPTSTPI